MAKKWKQSDFTARFQKWKQTHQSINQWRKKHIRTDPHNRILLSNNKETIADTKKHGWISETLCWTKENSTHRITFAKTHWTVDVKYMHLNRETGLNKLKGACVSGNKWPRFESFILVPHLKGCVTLDNLCSLNKPQFPHLENGATAQMWEGDYSLSYPGVVCS